MQSTFSSGPFSSVIWKTCRWCGTELGRPENDFVRRRERVKRDHVAAEGLFDEPVVRRIAVEVEDIDPGAGAGLVSSLVFLRFHAGSGSTLEHHANLHRLLRRWQNEYSTPAGWRRITPDSLAPGLFRTSAQGRDGGGNPRITLAVVQRQYSGPRASKPGIGGILPRRAPRSRPAAVLPGLAQAAACRRPARTRPGAGRPARNPGLGVQPHVEE